MAETSGFDPKIYSDEELLDRSVELIRKMNWANRMGSMDAVTQLQAQKLAIEMEQRERMFRNGIGNRILNLPDVVVESDPDLAASYKAAQEDAFTKAHPAPRSRPKPLAIRKERVRPTSQPTNDDSE